MLPTVRSRAEKVIKTARRDRSLLILDFGLFFGKCATACSISPHCCKGVRVEPAPRTDIGQSPRGACSELQLESRVARDEPEPLVEAMCFLPRRVRGELNQRA